MSAIGQQNTVRMFPIVCDFCSELTFHSFASSTPYTQRDQSLWLCESSHCVFVFLCYSRWREAGDEGSKVDQQRDAERISVTVHSQGPTGKSCSKKIMILMFNLSVCMSIFLDVYNKSSSFKSVVN